MNKEEIIKKLYSILPADWNISKSKMGVFQALIELSASFYIIIQNLLNLFVAEQKAKVIQNNSLGSRRWYEMKAYEFQFGDKLDYSEEKGLYYSNIDENKQIITKVFVHDIHFQNEQIRMIKVAGGTKEEPAQMTNEQMNGFGEYISEIQIANSNVRCVSLPADILKIDIDVWLDYSVVNAEETLKSKLEELRKNNTTGIIEVSEFIAELKKTFNDVYINSLTANKDDKIKRIYKLQSGYFVWDFDNSKFNYHDEA